MKIVTWTTFCSRRPPPHAPATAIGSVYQATYDAAGDMTCRAPGSGVTCSGSSPNGQTMTYDALRQLAHWQNTPSSPLTQDDYLYDGSGQRAMQYVNVNGTITTTAYLLGGVEESSGSVITKYLGVSGLPMAVRVGATLSYLASDGLGSMSEAFDTAGNETAAQLYAPYGTVRYAAGSMPTSKGFTGQRADVTTGLDYYGARYYDAQAGQFAAADSVSSGLSPYAYVAGNPETKTDPSGHVACAATGCSYGNSGQSDSGDGGTQQPPTTSCSGFGVCDPYTGVGASHHLIDEIKGGKSASCTDLTGDACPLTAAQIAAGQKKAYDTANDASKHFLLISILLTIAGILLGGLATLVLNSGNPILGGALLGLSLALGVLAGQAALLSLIFSNEHDAGQSAFNHKLIGSTESQITGLSIGSWALAGFAFLTPFILAFTTYAAADTDKYSTNFAAAFTFVGALLTGNYILTQDAYSWIDTENRETLT